MQDQSFIAVYDASRQERSAGAILAGWVQPCPESPDMVILPPFVIEAIATVKLNGSVLLRASTFLELVEEMAARRHGHQWIDQAYRNRHRSTLIHRTSYRRKTEAASQTAAIRVNATEPAAIRSQCPTLSVHTMRALPFTRQLMWVLVIQTNF